MAIRDGFNPHKEAEFRSSLIRVRPGAREAEQVAFYGAEQRPVVKREEPVVDEANRAPVPEQLRDWISRVLKQYSLFYVAYAPFVAAYKACNEADARSQDINRLGYDVETEAVVTGNIQARVDQLVAISQMMELQIPLADPTRELRELLEQFEAFYKALPTDFTGDVVETRALIKQCEALSAAMLGVIGAATRHISAPHVALDEKEARRCRKRAEKIAALAAAVGKGYDAHCTAKRLTAEIKQLYEKMQSITGWRRNIEDPTKPSAEEVLAFIEGWFERKREIMEVARAAHVAFREQGRALAARREALIFIRESLYHLPQPSAVGDDYQCAVIEEAQEMKTFLKEVTSGIDASEDYKNLERMEPALEKPAKADLERELSEALRTEIEMVAYCVGARNFANRAWEEAKRESEPRAPQVGDGFESGEAYAEALRAHRKAMAEHRNAIWRKECIIDARQIQLEAVISRLNRTVERAVRMQRATDTVLLPLEVAETMVWLYGRREGKRHAR